MKLQINRRLIQNPEGEHFFSFFVYAKDLEEDDSGDWGHIATFRNPMDAKDFAIEYANTATEEKFEVVEGVLRL